MQRILVCLDSLPRSTAVLAAAVDLATRTGAKLDLLRTVGIPTDIHGGLVGLSPAELSERLAEWAHADLATFAASAPPGMVEGRHVRVGTPWDAICREAISLDVDLIVLGSHGHTVLDRLLGTTAARVVNHADRSVLVVREKGKEAPIG
jgi:nucleotide-binding universal stress UspA family protein